MYYAGIISVRRNIVLSSTLIVSEVLLKKIYSFLKLLHFPATVGAKTPSYDNACHHQSLPRSGADGDVLFPPFLLREFLRLAVAELLYAE